MTENQISIVIVGDLDPHGEAALENAGIQDLRRTPDLNGVPALCAEQTADVVILGHPQASGFDPSAITHLRHQDERYGRYTAVVQCVTAEQLRAMPPVLVPGVDDYLLVPFDGGELPLRLKTAGRISALETRLYQRKTASAENESSLQDSLTGLGNWRYLIGHLESLLLETRARGGLACCALLSIDQLARLGERHGQSFKNELLRTVAKRLRGALRPVDFLARTGDNEFGVALRYPDSDHIRPWIFERLLRCINYPPFSTALNEIDISISVGVACDDGRAEHTAFDMLAVASGKMREAQEAGGNSLMM